MKRAIVTTLLIDAAVVGVATAQQASKLQTAPRDTIIAVNSTLPAVTDALARAKFAPGGLKQFAADPNGDDWLFYSLEPGKADLVLQYSPRTNRLTDLEVYFLGQPMSKTNHIAMRISSITLHPDGSYSLRFPPRRPREK